MFPKPDVSPGAVGPLTFPPRPSPVIGRHLEPMPGLDGPTDLFEEVLEVGCRACLTRLDRSAKPRFGSGRAAVLEHHPGE